MHHITAICGDPRDNLRFYRDVLGLRLVKQTVNSDSVAAAGT
ncbi:VOC family protein [Kushneria aurantia]|uniref:VOC family protein n=1 Tax=Kushneria aurantia TaxID=504092 RepID=A0ABV6G347_9GAMM|nr:VOC family protein [Kushneria aurantia]